MALFCLALLGLDLLLVTRGEAITLAVREQLQTSVGPGLTIGDATLSLSGVVTLTNVRFSPGGREVAAAPEAQIEIDVLRGQPKSIRIPRLDMSLDPDRMRDLEAWTPADSSGAGRKAFSRIY